MILCRLLSKKYSNPSKTTFFFSFGLKIKGHEQYQRHPIPLAVIRCLNNRVTPKIPWSGIRNVMLLWTFILCTILFYRRAYNWYAQDLPDEQHLQGTNVLFWNHIESLVQISSNIQAVTKRDRKPIFLWSKQYIYDIKWAHDFRLLGVVDRRYMFVLLKLLFWIIWDR